jgi:hypothetical protein
MLIQEFFKNLKAGKGKRLKERGQAAGKAGFEHPSSGERSCSWERPTEVQCREL